ncbi:MAG: beta-glucosidase [Spirochaetes bacterium]|nr:beta-glucosidase [Spirochaetota bacterium]MBU1082395.1 beta-glucosidase [Spirochaetota bacterium]
MPSTEIGRSGGFPDGFLWGCATSSYQIEGAAGVDGRGPSIWDAFCREPGRVSRGQNGDVACDSYRRWPEDVRLLSELGVGAYRFSVAWPRVQPDGRGGPNRAGLDYYSRLADALLERGIEPWVTLYHWDLPLALGEAGGWTARDTAYRFADYASIVYGALGDRVGHWTTLNEPWCSAFLGYEHGEHAPGLRDRNAALRAAHHLLLAHGLAVEAFRSGGHAGEIGLVINPATPRPATRRPADLEAARRASVERTGLWLDPVFGRGYPAPYLAARGAAMPALDGDMATIAAPVDFVGVNYYNEDAVAAAPASPASPDGYRLAPTSTEKTEMGWDVVPQGLRRVLGFIAGSWPVGALYVTENGAAYADTEESAGRVRDADRVAYYRGHLAACRDAISDGVPLRGYFAWSLLDNFEWAHGYDRRFGLVSVDPRTLERRPKDSYYFYRDAVAGYLE